MRGELLYLFPFSLLHRQRLKLSRNLVHHLHLGYLRLRYLRYFLALRAAQASRLATELHARAQTCFASAISMRFFSAAICSSISFA